MRRKRYQSLNMMKHSFHPGTLHQNDVGRMPIQCYEAYVTSLQGCSDVIRCIDVVSMLFRRCVHAGLRDETNKRH